MPDGVVAGLASQSVRAHARMSLAEAHYGLVVTSVPKVPIWKACDLNALHCM